MATSLAPGGSLEIITPSAGPQRPVKVACFFGRGDTGLIANSAFRAGENPVAIINATTGANVTSSFSLAVPTGGINQTDTGTGGTSAGTLSGHTLMAILTDTGTAGL